MEIQNVQKYIYDYSGLEIHFKPWMNTNSLPMFISSNFEFYSASTDLGTIMAVVPNGTLTFSKLFNTYRNLERYEQRQSNLIYILPKSSPYMIKRLIDQRISFIIPGRQIYAPFLGAIYSHKSRQNYEGNIRTNSLSSTKLSPSTLSVFLFLIKSGLKHKQNDVAEKLKISRMTLHRAYKELMREKMIIKTENNEIILPKDWKLNFRDNCLKFKSPIRRRVYIDESPQPLLSNLLCYKTSESALQGLSELAEPTNESYAIYYSDWNKVEHEFTLVPNLENDGIILEIWSIPVPNDNGIVSPLALYLTMKSNKDERIKMAIETMLDQELIRYD
ncbi:MAG: hypothetical protein FD133_308 [Erysipelotrichaceae bacterium]|nr:MAG: hypothetical protein FD179_1222 [Erysipelotrichaceae bacterium]TXT19490.1 MAG: hypothetical protein FD133_308 [Erysipelotrichaceae bacterium]